MWVGVVDDTLSSRARAGQRDSDEGDPVRACSREIIVAQISSGRKRERERVGGDTRGSILTQVGGVLRRRLSQFRFERSRGGREG